jgi:hypothetical protein
MNAIQTLQTLKDAPMDERLNRLYRRLAMRLHPDKGGSIEAFAQLAKIFSHKKAHSLGGNCTQNCIYCFEGYQARVTVPTKPNAVPIKPPVAAPAVAPPVMDLDDLNNHFNDLVVIEDVKIEETKTPVRTSWVCRNIKCLVSNTHSKSVCETCAWWSCEHCDIYNHVDNYRCCSCDIDRSLSGWRCTECTVFNKHGSTVCELCDNTR